jgi:hypothetical protein
VSSSGRQTLGGGEGPQVVARRLARATPCRLTLGPAGDLRHVGVGRVQQVALVGDREDSERARAGRWRTGWCPRAGRPRCRPRAGLASLGPDLLADVQHRRLVALALADDDGAAGRHALERGAHRLDGGRVGRHAVAAADHAPRQRSPPPPSRACTREPGCGPCSSSPTQGSAGASANKVARSSSGKRVGRPSARRMQQWQVSAYTTVNGAEQTDAVARLDGDVIAEAQPRVRSSRRHRPAPTADRRSEPARCS